MFVGAPSGRFAVAGTTVPDDIAAFGASQFTPTDSVMLRLAYTF